jgi:hypothetical protein
MDFSFDFDITGRNHADDIIDDLIEKVLLAYPPERLKRIKARSESAWKNISGNCSYNDRIPYVVLNSILPEKPEIPDDTSDIQRDMINQLKSMFLNSVIDDEYYPAFSSGVEQVTIPSMFGCVKEIISGSDHIKPIINSPSDVYSLPNAKICEGYICYDMLYRMAYKYRRANGRIPVYMTDIQGPFSCASQMWGIENFLCDLDEYSNEVHHILSLCSEAIIKYFHAMYDAVDGDMIPYHCSPVLWIPKDCGVAVSDDFFAVVGENTVKEYSIPYLEKIGQEFGGITAHTCGNMNHLASLLSKAKNLKALNFGSSETDLMKFAQECDPRITLIVHKSGMSIKGLPLFSTEGHIKHCTDVQRNTGVRVFSIPMYTAEALNDVNLRNWENAAKL